jgi:hypothetical protein
MGTLIAVRTALKNCESKHAALFTSLIENGKLGPYKSKYPAKRDFGSSEADYLILGRTQTPEGLRKSLSAQELQEICLQDLPEARKYYGERLSYFVPCDSANNPIGTSKQEAGMRLIHSLTDISLDAMGVITTFPSEALEKLCIQNRVPAYGLLREPTMTTCTILPSNTLLPLHHSNEGTTITMLMTGSVIWIIWPSTDHNLTTLQAAYKNVVEDFDATHLDVARNFEGGLTFVQAAGEGLRIPPLCPMVCLATGTSVFVTYSEITVDNFVSILQKLPFLKAWFQTEVDGQRKQSDFNASILRYLDILLNGDAEAEGKDANNIILDFAKDGPLDTLLRKWDGIKDDLAAMMGPADSITMENIWGAFLIAAKGRECWICHKQIRNKQRLMKKHFTEQHWPKASERPVDSMDSGEEENRKEGQGRVEHNDVAGAQNDDPTEGGI